MQLESVIDRKYFINTFLLVIFYGLVCYGIQFFMFQTGEFSVFPTAGNLVGWDSGWYRSIATEGYKYSNDGQSNAGFFWLFAAIWKLTGADGWCISLLCLGFFAAGFSLLAGMCRLSTRDKLLWLTMPAVFFAFVPYAEALFFLLASLCMYGINANKRWVIWLSLFLLSLTRATSIFVIPAFLCMELAGNSRNSWLKSLGTYLVHYVLPSLAGLATFVLIQYQQTHVWFAYFIVQSKFWKRIYATPVFPLVNGRGDSTIWLNALAVFTCFTAFIFAISMMLQWVFKDKQRNKLLVLSILYLAMTFLTSLFYTPQWVSNSTNVIGTFRYTMMNPFFYIFIYYFTHEVQYKWYHYVIAILFASGVWMAFGAYVHILYFLFFTANTLMIMLYMLHSSRKLEWPSLILIAINFLLQVHFFQHFISATSLVD